LGQYQYAIELHQQSLEIRREVGYRLGEANSLYGLGNAYYFLEQYQRAIELYQQSLEIERGIGDHLGEAFSLYGKALALAKYESRRFEAISTLRQARDIYADLQLDNRVEECDEAIYGFEQIIATEQSQSAPSLSAPTIGNSPKKDDWYDRSLPTSPKPRSTSQRQIKWVLLFCIGISIVLLIAWLRSK